MSISKYRRVKMDGVSTVTAVDIGGHFHGSLLNMVLDSGTMVQFVLLLLLLFSIISWAIILSKY